MNNSSSIWWRHLPAACNNFLEAGVSGNSKPFQSGKNQLKKCYAILVRPKPTFSIPSHSSQNNIVNTFFLLSLPCRSWSPNYSVLVSYPWAAACRHSKLPWGPCASSAEERLKAKSADETSSCGWSTPERGMENSWNIKRAFWSGCGRSMQHQKKLFS
jgi:hypothetical protein